MATLESFESTLKEVVQAKRLSASKMTKLTDIALKSMENDTQLVSVLFRTHKSLSVQAKVSSLYVFDALARAARNQVNKQGLMGDLNSQQGNCATFLLKVEGVLDSLYQDLVSSGYTELKEKAKKVLDIWIKSNTFPSAVLGRLSQYLKEAEKEPEKVVAPAADAKSATNPALPTTPPQAPPTAPSDSSSVQSTLIALLSQAANAVASNNNAQTNSNTATSAPSVTPALEPNALALLQQLTQATKLGSGVPKQPVPLPVSLVPSSTSSTNAVPVMPPAGPRGPLHPPPYRDAQYGHNHREPQLDRYDGTDRGRDRNDYYDDRRDHRGGFRGGFRGRGRGRWDDRDRYNDRSRDREWTPPRGRHSRSHSPPNRPGGRRDVKPYSPPRRPSMPQDYRNRPANYPPGPSRARGPTLDEFGREIRAGSTDSTPSTSIPTGPGGNYPPIVSAARRDSTHSGSDNRSPVHNGPASQSPPSRQTDTATSQKGLDSFDMTTFDPSSPASWEALGNAWAVTNGYLPSQEELMQFMFSGMAGNLPIPSQPATQQGGLPPGREPNGAHQHDGPLNRGSWRGGRAMGGRGRGRGGDYRYGNGRDMGKPPYEGDSSAAYGSEYAVQIDPSPADDPGSLMDTSEELPSIGHNGGGPGDVGRMQRVGDRWVFVRAETSGVA